ncbi:MAG: MMPL family transporter [Mariprofundaceae bacterium]
MIDVLERLLLCWAGIGVRWPRTVLLIVMLLVLAAGYGSVTQLGFNSNTDDMLSSELPFRQAYSTFQQQFPQFSGTILVLIDGDTPETARTATKRLANRLQTESDMFQSVYLPRANEFIEKNGLLYLDLDNLEMLSDELAAMQPFLGTIAADPSLRGLFAMLEKAIIGKEKGEDLDLAPVLKGINATLAANLTGQRKPMSWETLMHGDSDEHRQFLIVRPQLNYHHLLAAEPAIKRLRAVAAELQINAAHGLNIRLTGGTALAYEELISIRKGAGITAMAAMVSVAVVLFIGLGCFRLVAATLITLLAGLMLTVGFATIAIGSLNLISVAFAVLYIGLAVDYSIHFCLYYKEIMESGAKQHEIIARTIRGIGLSLLLCSFTTAIGFFCFIPTAYVGVSELGLIAGAGMFIGLALTLILLPALLSFFPPQFRHPHALFKPIQALIDLPMRHRGGVRITLLIFGVGAIWLLPHAQFDYNPVHLRDPSSESVATFLELMRDNTTSPWRIMVLLPDAEKAADMAAHLGTLKVVDKAVFLADFVPGNQSEKLDIIEDMELILGSTLWPINILSQATESENSQAISSLYNVLRTHRTTENPAMHDAIEVLEKNLKLYIDRMHNIHKSDIRQQQLSRLEHNLLDTFPTTLARLRSNLQAEPVTIEHLPAQLHDRWLSPSGMYRIEVSARENIESNAPLHRFVRAVQKIAPHATGAPVFTLEAGEAVVKSFQQAFATALVVIFLLLLLVLRSLRDSLLIVVPLLFAFALLNAAALALSIPFNFANIIALPLLLGLGVDNGIHMVRRARTAMPESGNLLHTSTARAVFFSALTTLCSFGALSFSAHVGTASMGKILTLGVLIILVGTLIARPVFSAQKNEKSA